MFFGNAKQIDARTIIMNETPQAAVYEDKPDDPSRWHPRKLTYVELLKRYDWDDAAYDRAKRLGLPLPVVGSSRETVRYEVGKLKDWEDMFCAIAPQVQQVQRKRK